ncbi:MarR family transcriptional regulator, partial [Actinomycetes bacterium KLBMP 9759]
MPKQSAVERAAMAAAMFGGAADAVDEAAASVLGINRTDLRLLGIVQLEGPRSAGQLSVAAGL